jgi:endonuclease-3
MENSKQTNPIVDHFAGRQAKYEPVASLLREVYGPLVWKQTQSPLDELISCILSQSTSDINRDRGFAALKERYPTWQAAADAPEDELIDTIRPAGLANQKGPRIQRVLRTIKDERGAYDIEFLRDMTVDEARDWLVALDGVGPKTAAIVLCFAFGRPAFPVDTHIHRVSKRIGFIPETMSAEKAHPVMEAIVPPDKYYEFHLHLIFHGRETCTARRAYCERCPLTAHCDYYAQLEQNRDTDD